MALDRDAILICAERRVTGYPFRVIVQCGDGTKIGANGRKLALGGIRVAAQVYNPAHLIAEVDSPARMHFANGAEIDSTFDLAHASAQIDLSNGSFKQLITEIVDVVIDLGPTEVAAAELDMSVRRNPEVPEDLDFAMKMRGAVPSEGLEPSDISVRGRISGGAVLLKGRPEQLIRTLARQGLPFVIEAASVECGDMMVGLSGTLELRPDGLVDGQLDVAVAGYEMGLPYVNLINPKTETVLSGLLTNFFANAPTTMVSGREARMMSITIEDSRIKPGGWLPVATLPPLPLRFR